MQPTHKYWAFHSFCKYLQSPNEDSGWVPEIPLEIQDGNSGLAEKSQDLRNPKQPLEFCQAWGPS